MIALLEARRAGLLGPNGNTFRFSRAGRPAFSRAIPASVTGASRVPSCNHLLVAAGSRDLSRESADAVLNELPPGVHAYSVDGPFFFGAVENFQKALVGAREALRVLIISLKRVPFMDITGLQTLEEIIKNITSAASE